MAASRLAAALIISNEKRRRQSQAVKVASCAAARWHAGAARQLTARTRGGMASRWYSITTRQRRRARIDARGMKGIAGRNGAVAGGR